MENTLREGIINKLNSPKNKTIEFTLEELLAIAKQYIHVEGNFNVKDALVADELKDVKAAFVLG